MFNTFTKCCSIIAMFALYFYSAPAAYAQDCDANELTLELVFDGYADETSWDIADAAGNIIASGGDYAYGTASATETACLADGIYTFTMYDFYADGMCCLLWRRQLYID